MLDRDLASLYRVSTRRLNEQVKRNAERFPGDFCFRMTGREAEFLKSQFATSSSNSGSHGGRRTLPLVFTEHGAIMAASVLNSPEAVRTSVFVVRAFVRLRQVLASNAVLARKLEALEKKFDARFNVIFAAIRELMKTDEPKQRRPIGFASWDEDQ